MAGRSVLVVVAVVSIGVGLGLALVPFDRDITIAGSDGIVVHGTSHCGVPVRAAFHSPSEGWFAYAPNTTVIAASGFACRGPAQTRAGVGIALVILGAAIAAWGLRPRSRGSTARHTV